ncbi:hypothetical protein QBC47DRAFT_390306 [Echria macrotheca]|uniref:Uncharacterized protein n=1 Tax=Echria macrotheca TaxID=438768 RepID=A0AAJ0B6B5_9PEZI|nr:hypothetical protein QBC47DRAFT_390306 [Echria macrotheca]
MRTPTDDDNGPPPPYTPEELAALFLDFYTFLTTLHYSPSDLQIPPPTGWPHLTPAVCVGKSPLAVSVLRLLPYFKGRASFHYKCGLIDYVARGTPKYFIDLDREWAPSRIFGGGCDYRLKNGDLAKPADLIPLARGYESWGREMFLDVRHGEIIEDMLRCDQLDGCDVKAYFDNLKREYRELVLIPCMGRVSMYVPRVSPLADPARVITEEEFAQQGDKEGWGTDLDVHFIRQLYQRFGWPDAFRAAEARQEVDAVMKRLSTRRERLWEDAEPNRQIG